MAKPARNAPRTPGPVAAIDIGSNAVRFALAQTGRAGFRIIEEKRRPTRLGANLAKNRNLPKVAIKATLSAVKEFCFDSMRHNTRAIRLVATAAVREAPDGEAFVRRLTKEVGLPVFVIGPDEEARLAFASCLAAFDISRKHVAIVDIGGGSVQVSLASRGILYDSVSMPLGAVRLTSAFAGPNRILRPAAIRRLQDHVDKALQSSIRKPRLPIDALIGCGGTFAATSLILNAAVPRPPRLLQPRDRPRPIARLAHRVEELNRLTTDLCSMDLASRSALLKRSGVPIDRAEILPAGMIVAAALAERLNAGLFVPHVGGVRDGILRELAAPHANGGMVDEARRFALLAGYERAHSEHVAQLSVALLHDLADVDRIKESVRERLDATELLESAAILHDLGGPIDYERHHKVSRRIIELAPWQLMDAEQRAIVANVARYHRKSLPAGTHEPFAALSRRAQQTVRTLAGALRVADGLDRDHRQNVHGVRVRVTPKLIEIVAEGARAAGPNIRAAQKKSDLLGAVTRRKILVMPG